MSVVAEKPLHGLRLVLTLDRAGARYEGTARTKAETWDVGVAIDGVDGSAGGGTSRGPTVTTSAPKEAAEWIGRVVRIAVRDAKTNGTRPPRKIQRWRAEKD